MRTLKCSPLLIMVWLLLAWPVAVESAGETILVVPKAEAVAFWEEIRAGAMDAGAANKVRVLYRGPLSQENVDRQRAILEEELVLGVDAVVLGPVSADGLADVVREIRRRNIPLVVVDSALDGDAHQSFIATDNREAGRTAARFLLSKIPPDGPVLILRHNQTGRSTRNREQGFAEEVRALGGDALLFSEYLGVSEGNAYHRTLALLGAHPEIAGVFASAEVTTLGCIRAIRELGLAGKVQVVGFDDTPEIRSALREGVIQGVMVQQPYRMGYIGVETALDAVRGKPVPRRIVTEAVLVTSPDGFAPLVPRP